MSGLDDFKQILKEYRGLALWAAGGSVAIPFVASFLSVIPPWPKGLDIITSVFQLLALIFAYQNFHGRSRRVATKAINRSIFGVALSIIFYLFMFSNFTIYVPETKQYIVIGFQCTDEAMYIPEYAQKCPYLEREDLKGANYVEHKLWTRSSISITRTILLSLWFLFFSFLATAIGVFLVFQIRESTQR
ncbi:hypothetical protein ELI00_37485 [Rhizobium ruizarguesonis]|uniref:hypothetical protein n=1 Tax=Rhizobium ruizarguesonis TaxID=2081791 RepID=UPI001030A781|nr:hypothetical protein [Rhizobium ruizarguesonis]TAX63339.1 hypothetical protein ELI00_37485 [Rhizobium ruizarguesonis]